MDAIKEITEQVSPKIKSDYLKRTYNKDIENHVKECLENTLLMKPVTSVEEANQAAQKEGFKDAAKFFERFALQFIEDAPEIK